MNSSKDLERFGFTKCGELKLAGDKIIFSLNHEYNDQDFPPKVYAWLACEDERVKVIYIGKTRYSIKKRMTQHRQGFKGKLNNGSLSGAKKFLALKEIIDKGGSAEVWARASIMLKLSINGERTPEKQSFYSVEEEFFISLFKPILNNFNH